MSATFCGGTCAPAVPLHLRHRWPQPRRVNDLMRTCINKSVTEIRVEASADKNKLPVKELIWCVRVCVCACVCARVCRRIPIMSWWRMHILNVLACSFWWDQIGGNYVDLIIYLFIYSWLRWASGQSSLLCVITIKINNDNNKEQKERHCFFIATWWD